MASPPIARILVFGLGLLVLASAPAAAADPTPLAGQPAVDPIKNDTGKRICRVEVPTGSRMSVRICKTADEWARLARGADDLMHRMQDGVRSPPCGGKLDCN
jgi:hypothetical protein